MANQIKYNDNTVWECISDHRTQYPNPIKLSKGEVVKLGEPAPEEKWKNWIWAENVKGQGGWVPVQLIDKTNGNLKGVVKEKYSARELNINAGENVIKIKSLNGWTWVRNIGNHEEGWIPDEVIKPKPVQL